MLFETIQSCFLRQLPTLPNSAALNLEEVLPRQAEAEVRHRPLQAQQLLSFYDKKKTYGEVAHSM